MRNKLFYLTIVFFALTNLVNAQTFSGATGTITDNNPSWDVFNNSVTGLPSLTSSTFGIEYVTINVSHTWDSDLNFVLMSPQGYYIFLSSGNGGSGDNYIVTQFHMSAATSITVGTAPFNGSYIPEEDLGIFNNSIDPNGIWQLYVKDDASGDIGTVNSWSITFSSTPATPTITECATSDCSSAINIASLPYTLTGQTTCGECSSFNQTDGCGSVFMKGNEDVFTYTPSVDGWVDVQLTTATVGNMNGAAVFLLDECPSSPTATCIASSTVQYPANHGAPHIIADLVAGTTYYIVVSNAPDPFLYNGDPCINYDIAVTSISQPSPTTQDCFNAIPLCFSSYTETNSFTSSGNYPSEINSSTSCLEGERNDVWYTFTVTTSGTVTFVITPANYGDDYDWAVYNITGETCSDVFSDPNAEVSCNYAMVPSDASGNPTDPGITGPDGSTTQTSAGPNDSQFNAALNVIAGETYVVNVGQWSSTTNGYSITFGGTAQVVDNTGASLIGITNAPACGEDVITVEISENVLCSSVDPIDWTVTGPGGPYTITAVNSSICNAGGVYDKFYDLTLNSTLTAGGTYTLNLVGQIDDLCSHATVSTSVDFTVTGVTATASVTSNVTCNSGADGSAVASATGGTAPYTYAWSNGGNTSTISGVSANTYTVTVTDNVGVCNDIQSVTITQPSPISVSFNTTDVQCNGGNDGVATAIPSGGNGATWTYQWDAAAGGGTSATTNTLSAGTTYTVSVYDSQTCLQTATVSVSEPTALAIDGIAQQEPNCFGDANGQLSVTNPNGGTPVYSYNWSAGGATTSQTNTGLSAGTYAVTVSDSHGCTLVQSNIVLGQPTALTNTNTVTDATCNGSATGSIATNASGGTGSLSYTWSANTGGQTGTTASSLTAGNYDVTITDANSCTLVNSTITVNEDPVINITTTSTTDATCGSANGSATVSASGGSGTISSYVWNTSPTQTGATVSNVAAGAYDVTVTDSHGCSEVATISIDNAAAPSISEVSSAHVDVACNGDNTGSAQVTGSGGTGTLSYEWSTTPTQTGVTATGLTAGTYTVSVTDDNGCISTVNIEITEPDVLNVIISASQVPTCNGGNNGQATASSSGGTVSSTYTYLWSAGGNINSATNTGLSAGTYTVTVTDDNSCTATTSVTLSEPTAVSIDATDFTNPLCFGDANGTATVTTTTGGTSGTGNYTYSWDTSPVQTGQTAIGLTAGIYNVTVYDDNLCEATTSFTLAQPTLVTASTSVTDVQCNGGNDGTATVTGSGGTGAYTYAWDINTGNQTTATATSLAIGTYDVTVTDGNGCEATSSATISEPSALSILSNTWQNVSCNGAADGYGIITGTGGTAPLTYLWGGGQTTDSIGSLAPGTYNLTITDDHNCTITDAVTITEPDVLTATVSTADALCNSYNGSISLAPLGGTTPYTYNWSNSETTQNISDIAGTYDVTITDANLCEYTTSGTINEPDTITVTYSTVESACGGATGSATVNPIGGDNNFTYSWNDALSQTTQTASNLSSGTYIVTIQDGNNCEFVQTININDLGAATITIDTSGNIDCFGDTTGFAHVAIISGTGPYTYSWENSSSVILSTTDTIFNLPAGDYNVTVIDNGCESNASVTITENPELILTPSYVNVSCFGYNDGEAIITPTGGYGNYYYSWSHDGTLTDSSATGLIAGNYTVIVSDDLSCNDTYTYSINQPNLIEISFTDSSDVLCYGDSTGTAIISVTGGTQPYASYLWSSGESSSSAVNLPMGYNTVLVTDQNGCTGLDSILINEPLAISMTAVITNSICGGSTGSVDITANGGTSPYVYNWAHDTTLTSNIANGLAQGTYTITVVDANGCENDSLFNVIDDGAGTVSVTSVSDVLCFGESTGTATVDMTGGTADFTYVISMGGINIDSTTISNTSYDITNLVVGTYDVIVYDANGCLASTNITVNQPTELIISDSTINIDCYNNNNGEIFITANGGTPGYSYTWNLGTGDSVLTNLSAGYYSVTVSDYNICNKTIDSIEITQPTELVLNVDGIVDLSCNNDSTGSITVSATGGTPNYTYLWSNGETTNTISSILAGTYTVTITDNNLCSDTIIATVTEPTVLMISDSNYIENYYGVIELTTLGGTPDYTYIWSNGETTNLISGLYAGDYWVTVTDANGCVVENYYKVDIELIIPSVITPNNDGKNDKFRIININSFEQVDIKVFNRWGDIIFDYAGTGIGYEDESKQWDGTYTGKELPIGSYVYIIDLNNDDDPYTGTVTIIR